MSGDVPFGCNLNPFREPVCIYFILWCLMFKYCFVYTNFVLHQTNMQIYIYTHTHTTFIYINNSVLHHVNAFLETHFVWCSDLGGGKVPEINVFVVLLLNGHWGETVLREWNLKLFTVCRCLNVIFAFPPCGWFFCTAAAHASSASCFKFGKLW